MLQLGFITNMVLIHPSVQGLTLVGHAQQVLRWDQRSRPFHCPPGDPLAYVIFVTAILLIQLEPENVARLSDKRFAATRNVHRRVSKKQRVHLSHRPSLHKCSITMEKPNGMMEGGEGKWVRGKRWRWTKRTFFFLRRDSLGPQQWLHKVNQLGKTLGLSDFQWRDYHRQHFIR